MNKKNLQGWLKHGDFILLEIICLQLCCLLSYWILRGSSGNPFKNPQYQYQSLNLTGTQVNYTDQRAEYVYLPIWTLIFEYMGKKYPLYMNGETGEIDGVVPYSKLKALLIFGIAFVVFFLIALLLGRVF